MLWEYKIIDTSKDGNPDSEYELTELGKEGWELVTIKIDSFGNERWYFKRIDTGLWDKKIKRENLNK